MDMTELPGGHDGVDDKFNVTALSAVRYTWRKTTCLFTNYLCAI